MSFFFNNKTWYILTTIGSLQSTRCTKETPKKCSMLPDYWCLMSRYKWWICRISQCRARWSMSWRWNTLALSYDEANFKKGSPCQTL